MTHKGLSDLLSAIYVAALLILTALGNAWAMMIAAAVGLIAGALILGRRMLRGSALAVVVAAAAAIAVSLAVLALRH
ncbi:MAG: hypothetical protein WAW06_05300 [bacterium]